MRNFTRSEIILSVDCNKQEEDNEMANKRKVKYPHLRRAALEMGYNFSYLWRVLEGKPGFKGRAGLREEYHRTAARISAGKAVAS